MVVNVWIQRKSKVRGIYLELRRCTRGLSMMDLVNMKTNRKGKYLYSFKIGHWRRLNIFFSLMKKKTGPGAYEG